MNIKKLIGTLAYCLIGTLFFSACTDEDKTINPADRVAVSFSLSGIGTQPETRATSGKPLPDGTTVRILAYHRPDGSASAALDVAHYAGEATYVISGGGTTLTPCTVDDRGTVTSASGQEMQLLVGAYDFFTVTPALAATHTGDAPVVSVANGTDYASSTTGNQIISPAGENRGQTVTLEKLNRRCARLNFTIQCDETVNTITGIEVDELKLTGLSETPLQTAAMTEQAGVLLPAGDFTLTLNGADLPTDATNAKRATGSVIVLPKADAALGLSMQLCFNGSILPTVFDEVTIPTMAFEAGREYPLTITLSHGGVVTLTIGSAQSWGDGGDQDQPNAGFLPGITVGMPDWTLDEQNQGLGTVPYLSREGTANCYLVYDNNSYYGFDATVMGNGATTEAATLGGTAGGARIVPQPLSPKSAKVLWETGNVAGAVIAKVQLSPDKTKVLFKTGTDAGNAVIAVYDNTNPDDPGAKILWSWHIWKPETEVTDFQYQKYVDNTGVVKTADNYRMMDRYLGATISTTGIDGNIGALGLLYQWGRKDPFPGLRGTTVDYSYDLTITIPAITTADFRDLKFAEDPSTLSLSDNAACIAYTIEHPTTYMKKADSWREDWLIEKQDNLWGNPWEGNRTVYTDVSNAKTVNAGYGSKSIYDPCPIGYRVPPGDTWTTLRNGDGSVNNIQNKWNGTNQTWSTTLLTPTGSTIMFVPAGQIQNNAHINNAGDFGYCWYSSPYDDTKNTVRYFYMNCYNDFNPFGYEQGASRTQGHSVRCVKELN